MAEEQGYKVTFVDNSDEIKKALVGLSKTALRASGKVVRKYLRENIPVRSKRFKNHIGTWVKIDNQTGQPTLQIGFYGWQRVKKKGKLPSHANPHWIEFGVDPHTIRTRAAPVMRYNGDIFGRTVNHPGTGATHVLRDTVQNHISDIRAEQVQYLKEMSKKLEEAGRIIDWEAECEDDD